jgi:hypothetical protein
MKTHFSESGVSNPASIIKYRKKIQSLRGSQSNLFTCYSIMQNLTLSVTGNPFARDIILQFVHMRILFWKAKLAQNKLANRRGLPRYLCKKGLLMKQIFQFLVFVFLIACNNSESNKKEAVKMQADSLLHAVMEGHNIGMAKMSQVGEAKNRIQKVLDSISSLPTNLQRSSTQYKMELDSAFNRLTFAGYNMEKWMDEFNMDSFVNNSDKRIKYLESEKIKISNVKDAMISSLQKADSVLKRR